MLDAARPRQRRLGGLRCPDRFALTAGQAGDAPQALPLVDGLAVVAAIVLWLR